MSEGGLQKAMTKNGGLFDIDKSQSPPGSSGCPRVFNKSGDAEMKVWVGNMVGRQIRGKCT